MRLRRSTERLTFCWYCLRYNNQIPFCNVLQLWRKIDYGNCLILSGHNRTDVDSYKEEYGKEHKVDIWLYKSRHHLNDCQKNNAEYWKGQRETERDKKEAQRYFEDNKSSFKEMGYQASIEYLRKQNLRRGVLIFVKNDVANLLQPDL